MDHRLDRLRPVDRLTLRSMTAAVCVACGAFKIGAWTRCPACPHEPRTEHERAQALLLSDRHLSASQLAAASANIKAGMPPQFEESDVQSLAVQIAAAASPRRIGIFAVVSVTIGMALIGGLGVLIVYALV